MNQKKCPKCGENNPAEAVMCWACYTPLSGGAAVAAGAGTAMAAPGATVVGKEDGEKKTVAPWQIGIIVGALLLGLGFGAYSMMGSSEEPTVIDVNTTPGGQSDGGSNGPSAGPGDGGGPSYTPDTQPSGPSSGPSIAPVAVPYTLVSSPNVRTSWGVMAIVPNKGGISVTAAASLAKFARGQYNNVRGWQGMQIYVFQDTESAQLFNEFQNGREQARLQAGDYAQLGNVWPRCLAVYEYRNGGGERVLRPSTNPTGWWKGRR